MHFFGCLTVKRGYGARAMLWWWPHNTQTTTPKHNLTIAATTLSLTRSPTLSPPSFVCGTQSSERALTHASMARHDAGGALLCVHSVCVAAAHRRRGIALRMLRAYLGYVRGGCPEVAEVRLICKQAMALLYEKAGFEMVGPSPVVHGADAWFEMRHALSAG